MGGIDNWSDLPRQSCGYPCADSGLRLSLGAFVDLKRDDLVRTEFNDIGKVVHVTGLTVFVALPIYPKVDRIEGYLEGALTNGA